VARDTTFKEERQEKILSGFEGSQAVPTSRSGREVCLRGTKSFGTLKFWSNIGRATVGRIAYVSLIRHGPHIKRRLQLFLAAGMYLPCCYLATIGEYTDTSVQQFSTVARVFVAAETCLPSICLATIGEIHIQTHTDLWEGFMKYAVEMGSGAMIYIPSFIYIGSSIQTLMGGDTHIHRGSHKPTFILSK
jgi:hypothetical protein